MSGYNEKSLSLTLGLTGLVLVVTGIGVSLTISGLGFVMMTLSPVVYILGDQ